MFHFLELHQWTVIINLQSVPVHLDGHVKEDVKVYKANPRVFPLHCVRMTINCF